MAEQSVRFGDRHFVVCGDADDPYFAGAQALAAAAAPLAAWARRHLPPDGVVVDAGGNIGLTALALLPLVPEGQVHVFEPLPANVAHLRATVARNGIRNCVVNAAALGAECGRVTMHGAGSAAFVAASEEGAIPMLSLDRYVEQAGLPRLDLVKVDVEGFEPAVLAGARQAIERFRPPVFMEFNAWCLAYLQGHDARAFGQWLWDGFDVMSLSPDGTEAPAGGGHLDRFLHDTLVLHGAVDEVLLRVRPGMLRPPAGGTGAACGLAEQAELRRLQALLGAMRRSTSWRITAPLRALRRALRPRA